MSKGFHTPPENQGQTVEIAYMCAGPQMVRRIHDRADGRTSYEVADVGPDDSWYETFEACNGAPPLTDWAPLDERRLAQLIEDWS